MNEDALRAMIRESIARHLGGESRPELPRGSSPLPFLGHASHYRYALPDSGGPCLIEPSVQCNHCGYCQSHGH
jgi:hypothetical protein